MSEIKMCGHGMPEGCCVDCFRARVAELEKERDAFQKKLCEEDSAPCLVFRQLKARERDLAAAESRASAAEQRVRELGKERDEWKASAERRYGEIVRAAASVMSSEQYGAAVQEQFDRAIAQRDAAKSRVTDLETALSTLLDAAERQAAGFPLEAEQWFAVRDYARARLPEKRAEEVERE